MQFALANHPDKVSETEREQAHVRFQKVQHAYDILKDPEQRAVYDERGFEGVKSGGHDGVDIDAELSELLSQMFGIPTGNPERKGRRTPDAIQEFEVSLEDIYKGKQVKMMSKRKIVCSVCKGYSPGRRFEGLISRSGGKSGAKPKKCPGCSGTGQKLSVDMFNRPSRIICGDCSGSGSILHVKDRCKKCKGTKLTEEKKLLDFWIEKGMHDGDQIVLKGEADQEPGKETGDVIFVLSEKDHEVFNRIGPNLQATLHITLKEALCGFSRVILTTLDGRGLSYTHTPTNGKIIRPKDIFKIVGEGMPIGKKSDEKGDLYLDVEIEFPEDGWLNDPTKFDLLKSLLSAPSTRDYTNGTPDIVDEVTLEKADPEEFGDGDEGWETESDGESDGVPEQCATQ